MAAPQAGDAAVAAHMADLSGTVSTDIPCRKCGYNLRGLTLGGRCPECGRPVGLSVQGDLLRFSDPNWLLKLQRGTHLIIASVIVGFIGGFVVALIFRGSQVPTAVLQLLAGIGSFVGAWFLTEPDPSGLGEDQYGTARKVIRVTLLIGIVGQVLQIVQTLETLSPTVLRAFLVLGVIAGLAGVVGQFAQLQYLSKLATRIPDLKLSDRARFLMWAFGISYGLLVVVGAILLAMTRAAGGAPPGGGLAALGCFAGLVGLAVLVFAVMYLFLLIRLGRAFGEQSQLARQIWGSAPQP
jgi:hypothetical protein